jgi:hypothetical protein
MNFLAVIFIFGIFVSALVVLGLVFGAAALNEGSFGGYEGRSQRDARENSSTGDVRP